MAIQYMPPSPQNLRDLKERLNFSGKQMADLFGLASAQQWHKYCGGSEPREMSLPMLFLAGAITLGPKATVMEVFDWCTALGATIVVRREAVGERQP